MRFQFLTSKKSNQKRDHPYPSIKIRVIRVPTQLIQFTPASGFHFTVDFFSLVQNSIELFPVISPTPNLLSFQPPNEKGSRGTGTPTLTPIMPALARSITYRAILPFCVNTEAAFPYG